MSTSQMAYVSEQDDSGFIPIFSDQTNSFSVEKVFLGLDYAVLTDSSRSTHFCNFKKSKSVKEMQRYSTLIDSTLGFVDFACTENQIHGVTSTGELYVCSFTEENTRAKFEPTFKLPNTKSLSSAGDQLSAIRIV